MSTPKNNFYHCIQIVSVAVFEEHCGTCNICGPGRITANKASSSINRLLEDSMKGYADKSSLSLAIKNALISQPLGSRPRVSSVIELQQSLAGLQRRPGPSMVHY